MENNNIENSKNTIIELDKDPVKREFIDDSIEFPQKKEETKNNLLEEKKEQSGNITF